MLTVVLVVLLSLTNASSDVEQARALRRKGDDAILLRRWEEAVTVLTQAIKLDAKNYLGYLKRSQAHMKAGNYQKALEDLDRLLEIKPTHTKSIIKRGEVLIQLGKFEEAKQALLSAKDKAADKALTQASELASRFKQITQLKASKQFDAAVGEVEKMIELGANRGLLMLEKCRISYLSGNFYQVVSDAMGLLKKDSSNTEALMIRAKAFYQLGEIEGCLNHLKQCVRVQPDHKECGDEFKRVSAISEKRDAALKLYKNNQFIASFGPLKEAIEVAKSLPPIMLELSVALCEAYNKGATTIDLWKEGVEACTAAAGLPDAPTSMTEFRGNLHQKLGNWNEAIADFTAALQKNPNNHQMRQKIQQVQNSKKIAERKDYYKILDVKRDASRREIKMAFRKLALIWHPDKHKGEEHEKANAMFQDLNEAYDVLSNEEKKQRYDRGEDVEGPQQARGGFNPFGGNPFGGGGGGQRQQFTFRFN